MIDSHTRSSHQALRQGRFPFTAANRKLLLGPCGIWDVTSPSSAIAETRLKCLGSVPRNAHPAGNQALAGDAGIPDAGRLIISYKRPIKN